MKCIFNVRISKIKNKDPGSILLEFKFQLLKSLTINIDKLLNLSES